MSTTQTRIGLTNVENLQVGDRVTVKKETYEGGPSVGDGATVTGFCQATQGFWPVVVKMDRGGRQAGFYFDEVERMA